MDSFAKLLKGCEEFQCSLTDEQKKVYTNLAGSQSPETLMITCSDSRLDPCQSVQAGPGDLFVIRNAGNIVPCCSDDSCSSDLGTVQFAAEVLKVKHIVVCGHSDCGAVKAMMNPDSVSSLKHLNAWVQQALSDFTPKADADVITNVRLNALHQLERLSSLDFIKERCEQGDLKLHAWVFHIGQAAIETFCFDTQEWIPVLQGVSSEQSGQAESTLV